MIKEQGVVVKVEGNSVWVETRQESACGSCSAADGCGTSSLASLFQRGSTALKVPNKIGASVGQKVTLGLSEGGLVRAALLVYMTPLLGMIFGGILMKWLIPAPQAEVLIIIGSLLGFVAGLIWVKRSGKKLENDARFQPVLLSVED